MNKAMNRMAKLGAVVFAALGVCATTVEAAQPTIPTPAGVVALPNIIYVIPYAVSSGDVAGLSTQTIVTINASGTAAAACTFQVQWIDFSGAIVGYSGGAGIVAPPGGSFEYTTLPGAPVVVFPFIQNVFSNLTTPFEGYANIRTGCPATTKTGVDAEFVTFDTAGTHAYRQIEPIRKTGNAGE